MIFGKRQNFFLTLEEETPRVELAMAEASNPAKAAETTAARCIGGGSRFSGSSL